MSERDVIEQDAPRRRFDPVAILALLLLSLLLGAIVWAALTPEAPSSYRVALPAATLTLPPATVPEPSGPPAATPSQAQGPTATDAGQDAAEGAEPETAPPAETPAGRDSEDATPPTAPAGEPAPASPPAEAAPETQAVVIPVPPSAQVPERRLPAPAPDGLAPVPDPELVEESREGPLPIIGKDGRQPWQVYARPFDANDTRPRIALIISGLGQSTTATEAAIQRLPPVVTLAFAPYGRNLDQWIGLARAAGHEILLNLPMEPLDYPNNDPGPHTLLTSLSDSDNRERLHYLLSRFPGYVGTLNSMGARFTTTPQSLRPVLEELKARGLIFVDARSSLRSLAASSATEIGLPRAINNRFIDIKASRDEIDERLEELERIAKSSGYALGIGSPYPVTIERVSAWAQELDSKGIALAPVTALVDKQPN